MACLIDRFYQKELNFITVEIKESSSRIIPKLK